ncbi:MAG TPA: glycosyltransferase family 39 protein [Ktedonobacteraceae bacterium]
MSTTDFPTPAPGRVDALPARRGPAGWSLVLWQFLRFGLVGCANTLVDLLVLNFLLWLWPAQNTTLLLLANTLAYAMGALNSFLLNRYWTFQQRGSIHRREVARFGATTLAGIACNNLILYLLNNAQHPSQFSPVLWANLTKCGAISGTLLISYLGMRLWVFVQASHEVPGQSNQTVSTYQGKPATGANLYAIKRACTRLQAQRLIQCARALTWLFFSLYSLSKEHTMPEADTIAASGNALPRVERQEVPMTFQQRLALLAVMLTAIFVNFYQLGQHGFGNLFYAAGVRSMADSLHNFFFVSYDPGGFVTVDKPPLGFWLQTLSVKLFGFTPFSIFLPQALAGVLAVLVLFHLVRRHTGFMAGLLAALALALCPLSVETARNNTIDSTLVLLLLLAAWAMMLATETGRWRWLLLGAGLVGLGFNVKMMEAYLVVPAFGLLYLLAAPRTFWLRLAQLSVALLVLLAVSLSWALAVDLTPASQRPYVGSSPNNSEISLAFGYNGTMRLLGRGNQREDASARAPLSSDAEARDQSAQEENSTNPTEHFGMRNDSPGPLRLFNETLGGQISWLLPLALLALLALAWQQRPRFQLFQKDRQQQALLLWGTWLLTMGIFFSTASFFHAYYMTTFAPAICALFGIGIVVMWRDYQRANWRSWLLPGALVATVAEQIHFIISNPAWGTWLIPVIASACALAILALAGTRLRRRSAINSRALLPALACGLAALLLTPAIWSATPALQNAAIRTPSAGPASLSDLARNDQTASPALLSYLEKNEGRTTFLAATLNSMSANALILATNQPVMAMGGFAGSDPILTTGQLTGLISSGTVRFFLLNNPSRASASTREHATGAARSGNWSGRNLQTPLTTWVTHHCSPVSPGLWQSSKANNTNRLYDCATVK